MVEFATWDELPTKGDLKARIDAFLRSFRDGDLRSAFRQCPLMVFVRGEGMTVRTDLEGAELAEHLSHAMFQSLDGQEVEALADAVPDNPSTWCRVITPPGEVKFEDLALDFPGRDEDDDDALDEARATGEGEVLANVHLGGEVTDITARYYLTELEGKWVLAFGNFDVM